MKLNLLLLLKFSFIGVDAVVVALEPRQASDRCEDIEPVVSLLNKIPAVTSACSSLLGYPRIHDVVSVTQTQTQTVTTTTATVTRTKAVTTTSPFTKIVRSRTTTFVTTSTFPPYTNTHYDVSYTTKTLRKPYTKPTAVAPSKALRGRALSDALPSIPIQEISSACSCVVTKPTSTVTATVTSTVTKGVKATTRQTSTTTVVETNLQTKIRTVRTTSYTQFVTTKTIKTTETRTITRCRGTNPSSWFNLQASYYPTMVDGDYNGKYLSLSSDALVPEVSATQGAFVSDIKDASALNIDCVGRLYAAPELYPQINFNFFSFSLVSFMNASYIERNGDYFIPQCRVDANKFLRSNLTISPGQPTNKWQTCPEYIEFYDAALVLGNMVPEDHHPNCSQFEWRVSNAGT